MGSGNSNLSGRAEKAPNPEGDSRGPLRNVDSSDSSDSEHYDNKSHAGIRLRKIAGVAENNVGVQTEEVEEEELDWELSDHVDRETQTLPTDATLSEASRSEAMVQTDCRYMPLASDSNTSAVLRNSLKASPKQLADVWTQTGWTTISVSTQTDNSKFCSGSSSAVERLAPGTNSSSFLELHADPSAPVVTSPLLPGKGRSPHLEFTPNDTEDPREEKAGTLDLWKRLTMSLDDLMPAFKMANKAYWGKRTMVDVSIQTEDDVTNERTEYDVTPPDIDKEELLEDLDLVEMDLRALTIDDKDTKDPETLVDVLCFDAENDLVKIRRIFRWIVENIKFDNNYTYKELSLREVLFYRSGVVKDIVNVFTELCTLAGIRCHKIHGFVKGNEIPVRIFEASDAPTHSWVAVYVLDSWRLIDPTWGSGYVDDEGCFNAELDESYFLTDPHEFILTHFPNSPTQEDYYERWQLLPIPLTLDEFNHLPRVTASFFACKLRLRKPKWSPVVFSQQTEVEVAASLLLRYKYKFYDVQETENEAMNQWVFCHLKESGVVASFTILAPQKGSYFLKVFATPDDYPGEEDALIPHVFTVELKSTKALRYPVPWPLHDGAWGPTARLYECGLYPVNQATPVINTWGGKKVLLFEKATEVLLMFQVFDSKGTYLEPKGILKREETDDEIHLAIVPPGRGFFKLLMFGIPKPQVKGKWRLPLLASYLVDCKMSLLTFEVNRAESLRNSAMTAR